jgi:hypothetical protein
MAPDAVPTHAPKEIQAVYSNSAWIGPQGGQVSVTGVGVTIPAGALSLPTLITVTRNEDDTVELGPHGQAFEVPVELLFVAPLVSSAERHKIEWFDPSSEMWTTIPSYIAWFGRAADLEHFSMYRLQLAK